MNQTEKELRKNGSPSVDIVLPCFNPQKNWQNELIEFYKKARFKFDLHFIIVNDGSTNTTPDAAVEHLNAEGIPFQIVSYKKNRGKGYALREGVKSSMSPFILYTDIDFPFTDESTLKLIELVSKGQYDVLAGSRDEAYYQKKMSLFRKGLSKTFRFVLKYIFRLKISDTQCGLKAFNEKGKKAFLDTKINRYLFDFEFIYHCSKNATIRLMPVEVELKDNVIFSKMKLKIVFQETLNLFYIIFFK